MGILGKRDGTDRKTENLNLRIDQKLDFAVWFAAQAAGQKKSEWCESALKKAATEATDESGKNWRHYWDASEGVRILNLLRFGSFDTDVEDDRLIEFVRAHAGFFFTDDQQQVINRAAVDVLWEHVESFSKKWFEERATSYWHVGFLMEAKLSKASLSAPEWPPLGASNLPTNDDEQQF